MTAETQPNAARIASGPRPKHAQLRDLLAKYASEAPEDQPIPSERELMASYDVSRATVRKAIDALVAEGVLRRSHGKGTFITRPRLESRLHLASFTQDMRRRGRQPSSRLLTIELEEPSPEVSALLRIRPGAPVWRMDRLRLADGEPVALENGWYSAELMPDLASKDLSGSLYELLVQEYGLVIDGAEQTLWGEVTDAQNARMLQAPINAPLLVFRRLSSADSRPVEFVVSRYRGDKYQLHMTLGIG